MADTNAQPVDTGDDFLADDKAGLETLEKDSGIETKPASQPKETTEADTTDPTKGKMVPHQALHEARLEAKAAKTAQQTIERKYAEDMAKLQGRLEAIQQYQQRQAQPKEPEIPAFDVDPGANLYLTNQQMRRELEELRGVTQQTQQERQQQQMLTQIESEVTRNEQEFAKDVPDYYDAAKLVMDTWVKEAQAVRMSPQEIQTYVQQNAIGIARLAAQRGVNPAELTYALAQARGYAKAEAIAPPAQAASKLDAIQRGQQSSKSASNAPGTAPAPNSVEAILAMDDDDFNAKFGDDKAWNKIFRGK